MPGQVWYGCVVLAPLPRRWGPTTRTGKTAVFVCATLQQLEPVNGEVSIIVLCHTRELAYQINNEYVRFAKYMPDVRTAVVYGGTPIANDREMLKSKDKCPHIIVGTPGRMNGLVREKALKGNAVKCFVLDECDKMLDAVGQSTLPSTSLFRRLVCSMRALPWRCASLS